MERNVETAVWERVVRERERADKSSRIATRHEGIAAGRHPRAAFHRRMAAVHRQSERRHLAMADLYCGNALQSALNAVQESADARRFSVMAEVAAMAGARAAVLTMADTQVCDTLVVASDDRARRAQDMEFVLGEGPVRDVLSHRELVAVDGPDLESRWSAYGRELRALGYHSVTAVPMTLRKILVGAMVLFDPGHPLTAQEQLTVERLGTSLTHVLSAGGSIAAAAADHRTDVVQAAEVIALHYGGTLDDAIAMIRTRAFTERRRVDSVVRSLLQECASDLGSPPAFSGPKRVAAAPWPPGTL